MKTEDLAKQGLTQEQIDFVMAENGKDLKKLQKENETLTADRDTWKEKAETAEETLKTFDGIDPANIQKELDGWKKKAEEAEKNAQQQIYQRDFADALKEVISSYKFSSEAAKKSVMKEIEDAGLKLKNGKILGVSDLISQIKENDASAFVDETQEQLEGTRTHAFIDKGGNSGGSNNGTLTRKDISAIKNPVERQAAIAKNLHLYNKGE